MSVGRRIVFVIAVLPLAALAGFMGWIGWLGIDGAAPSVCHGGVGGGSLERGRRLPLSGANFRSYSTLGFLLGRTFVHSAVRDAMRDAYSDVARARPELRFVYAETGWPWGGRFAPHATHRNGTAVDFHVPVRATDGAVAEVPTTFANHLGYEIEFDRNGRFDRYVIDFEAMALHLSALDTAARRHGIGIRRVIFDVDLQPHLFRGPRGAQVKQVVPFNRTQARMRHDEHYHVDFEVPCR